MAKLAAHAGSAALSTLALTLNAPVGSFAPEAGAPFSRCAGQVASGVRAAYRAQSGALMLTAIPAAVHALNEIGRKPDAREPDAERSGEACAEQ